MTDNQERSRSMAAYASSHAEPDPETTARLRERLQASMASKTARTQQARGWLQGAVIAALVIGIAMVGAWRMGWLAGGQSDARGVISTDAVGQDLALARGRVALAPHTLVRVTESGDTTTIELVDGEIEVRSDAPASIVVRAGAYELASQSPRYSVRRTQGVPVVTVHHGEVRVLGPDLPDVGIVMAAPAG